MAKRFGKTPTYEQWCEPKLVSNTLEILDREIPRLKSKIESVQLCFTTDPFMTGFEEVGEMSIAAIKKLNAAGIKCTVLTKGLLPVELSDLSPENEYGITLISLIERFRKRIEPQASPYKKRIAALKTLADKGCKTWVSIEPYPTPNLIKQDIIPILNAIDFTDKIIFGRTNYSKEISEYKSHKAFYNEQAEKVITFCDERGISYHIKSGTIT
jgi:DNA repair photolyase